ncbi:MAG TPA: hypothetical protein ENI39_05225 [Anaerolineae bacterium]|nr:hypothetical protein [Anaerolineae bacterium]
MRQAFLLIILGLWLIGCGGAPAADLTAEAVSTAILTSQPTGTFTPTSPATSTAILIPTTTPAPTQMRVPTETLEPTDTSTFVSLTPAPRPTQSPARGFLLWPFLRGTAYQRNDYLGRDSVFDRNRATGVVEPYDPSIPIGCSGGICVVDNHSGIDIGVAVGTQFAAAADLTIVDFKTLSGYEGRPVGVIYVSYGNGYTGRYAHAQLMDGISVGDFIPQCRLFGWVEDSDIGAPHLHFEVQRNGIPVDPYDSTVDPTGISLWTVYNEPQYCP